MRVVVVMLAALEVAVRAKAQCSCYKGICRNHWMGPCGGPSSEKCAKCRRAAAPSGGGIAMGDCADADARSAAVNAECCGDADCSSGAPDTCDAACARLLLPFVEDCLGLGSGHRRAQSSPFDGIIAECRAVMPTP